MSKIIAQVAIPISIALNEQFDYIVPKNIAATLSVGCRVLVPFGSRVVLGYCIKLKKHSPFENRLKPVIKNFDTTPVLDKNLLGLAEKIHSDYFCSFADAIQTVLPPGLKQLRKPALASKEPLKQDISRFDFRDEESVILSEKEKELQSPLILIQDLSNRKRWIVYAALIKRALNRKQSVIFLVPDHEKINPALDSLKLNLTPYIITSGIKPKESLERWLAIKEADFSFCIGTRSAIFAPVNNLGLIIIEEEEHFAYRQDQVPHYRASYIAFEKARKNKAQVVLGSFCLSLDSYVLSKKKGVSYLKFDSGEKHALVRIIDMSGEFRFKGKEKVISKVLEHRLADALERKEKILIFAQKKEFSTFLYCPKCKKVQACPRCSSSLRYHFKEKIVSCPTCQYKISSYDLCPSCQSAYVKYFGYGLEKVESEISHLFPSAKIFIYTKDRPQAAGYDIMLSTQQFLENPAWGEYSFDLVCVLSCEQMLGHIDFRSTERAFARLLKLSSLAKNEVALQSRITEHYAFERLMHHDLEGFLEHELGTREELNLPPVMQMASLMVRSKDQAKSLKMAEGFSKNLKKNAQKILEVSDPIAAIPFKVRGNYRYQIFIKYKNLDFIKKRLWPIIKKRTHGVIATLDPSFF